MTLVITLTGGVVPNPIGSLKRAAPPIEGLASFQFLSDSLPYALGNLVAGASDAIAIGAPAIGVAATFTDGNYIDTGIPETASMSIGMVVQRNAAEVMFGGSKSSADANGIALYTNGASPRKPVATARWSVSSGVAVSASTEWPVSPANYELAFAVTDAGALRNRLYIPRTGELVEAVCSGVRVLSGRNIILGPGPSPEAKYAGDTVLEKFAVVAPFALSTAQMNTIYAHVAKRIAGI